MSKQRRKTTRGSVKGPRDLYIHSRNAAQDRYGINLTQERFEELNTMIRERRGMEVVFKQTRNRTIIKLKPSWANEPLYAVYQPSMNSICTFLLEYMVEQMIRDTQGAEYHDS